MFTLVGYSRFTAKKSGKELVALYCEDDRKNVVGKYCDCFIVMADKVPEELQLGSHPEFFYPRNSDFVNEVIWHE